MNDKLQSMTGFGRGESENDNFRIITEIKSVNNRFKDFRFRIPNVLNKVEIELKNALAKSCKRGTFDISINLKKSSSQSSVKDIDFQKVNAFLEDFKKNVKGVESLEVKACDFLRNEFYTDLDDQEEEIIKLAMTSFEKAVQELVKSRTDEGKKLYKILADHRQQYVENFEVIRKNSEKFNDLVKERLLEKFKENEADVSVEEPRFVQEVIYYLEKMDINEEINRIDAHLTKLDKVLNKKVEVGREVEFLLQELNRETNTIGSKSSNTDQSENVVKMKVELEKMREQGLNLQ